MVLGRLKYDLRTDPNYTYTLAVGGTAWEAHANAKKAGFGGFYSFSLSFPTSQRFLQRQWDRFSDQQATHRALD